MHDWWLALVASSEGEVIFLKTPLVYYRQHGFNTIGAKKFTKEPITTKSLMQRLLKTEPNQHLFEVAAQAKEFRKVYGAKLSFQKHFSLLIATFMSTNLGPLQRLIYRIARVL